MFYHGIIPINPEILNIPIPPVSQAIEDNNDDDLLDSNDLTILDNG